MPEATQNYALNLGMLFLFVIFNGIFAMTEFSIASSSRNKLEILSKKKKSAQKILTIIQEPSQFLSTIQIGITCIAILSGAFSAQSLEQPLTTWLNQFQIIEGRGSFLSLPLIITTLTYISIVLGEIVPKRIAMNHPEAIALFFYPLVDLFSKIFSPMVFLLNISSRGILKLLQQDKIKTTSMTEEEIQSVMEQGLSEGTIDQFEHNVFQKIMKFGDREASMIMTPRIKVIYLDLQDSLQKNIEKIISYPHRYYPVFDGGLDKFLGIVDAKDALAQQMRGESLNLRILIKKAPCVIEDSIGPDLIEQFKKYKTHIGIVVDEYGVMQGIITLVDLFETLVGTIPELNQEKHYTVTEIAPYHWICDGLTPIDEIEELLNLRVVETLEEENFDTLAGFLLVLFKQIPKNGEVTKWDRYVFEIKDMEGTRINKVSISVHNTTN